MTHGQKVTIEFNDKIVRQFMLASLCWGIVGMLVGIVIATQLNYWQANFGQAWLTFGRLRPLHTNAVIFAFVGNMMFAGIYYSTQRLLKARMASDWLSAVHFWGWQLIIVAAAVTLPLGLMVDQRNPLANIGILGGTIVVSLALGATYEIFTTAHLGGTLGKLAVGLRVVDEEGHQLDLLRSTYRYLAQLLSGLTCTIGYLIMIGHPRHQTLHDRMVGTLVVKK